jgi:hypothetical protein
MTTDTGMTAVGTIVETIGAETTGVEISGVESKPAEKLIVVIGSATKIGPCGTATRPITATIVARPAGEDVRTRLAHPAALPYCSI